DKVRYEFAFDTHQHECNKKKKSHDIHVCMVNPTCPPSEPEFRDTAGSPFASSITQLADISVVSGFGDGTFRPNTAITRGQVTKMVVIAYGITNANPN